MLAVKNGKLVTIANGIIENGTILIENGKIKAIGANVAIPADAEVIDATGKWVTPGLIDAHSHIGLFGEPMVPANMDGNEITAPVTAQLRGMDSLNPFDMAVPQVVAAGITTVYTGPGSANVIGGTGNVIKLRGRTVDEMIIPGTEGMKMALGENPKRCYGEGRKVTPSTRMGNAAVLREALVKAQNYMAKFEQAKEEAAEKGKAVKLPDRDLQMEALGRVLRREIKARIHCHRADDIMTAIRVAEEFNLDYVIEHCTEGWKIADVLGAKHVRACVGPNLLEAAKMELLEVNLGNCGILAKAGVKVALTVDSWSPTKWLPVQAGIMVREGMPEDEAWKSMTINPAEILGVADRVGTLEVGKDADLAIFDGHPMFTFTHCEKTIIDGVVVHDRANDCGCCCK
jgi:imidazolonepropionase-like amidohydrolase